MEAFGIWTAALLTIGIISFLYKDNVLYRVCESIFVGVSAGYWFVTYFWDNLYRKFYLGINDAAEEEESQATEKADQARQFVYFVLRPKILIAQGAGEAAPSTPSGPARRSAPLSSGASRPSATRPMPLTGRASPTTSAAPR